MRRNQNKDVYSPPHSLGNANVEQDRIAKEKDIINISEEIYKGNKITITDPSDPYNGQEEYEVRYLLRILFHNKCAYCECPEFKPDVEHYRPKKRVTGPQRNNHGYYWLCYEWSNLLPSCSACNSKSGKWNQFPLLSQRVISPPLNSDGSLDFEKCKAAHTYLLSEQPALLHPEIDEPETYFELKWDGRLTPLDGDLGRGFHSCKTCDLNRGNLIYSRKSIIDDLIQYIKSAFISFRNGNFSTADDLKTTLKLRLLDLKDKTNPSQPYSFVSFFIWMHFPAFIEQNFTDLAQEEAEVLKISYQDFL